jgi:hypothetical protein
MPTTLGALIDVLEAMDPDYEFSFGLSNPHSYRGYYERLAFSLSGGPQSADDMLQVARSALGVTMQGYKGGDFVMHRGTLLYLANYGDTGVPIEGFGLVLGERD